MIVKMTKYQFVVLSQELDTFLSRLQELGMVDITRSEKGIDQSSKEMIELSSKYKSVISLLKRVEKEYEGVNLSSIDIPDQELLQTVENTLSLKERYTALRGQLTREIKEAQVWGEFSNSDIDRLGAIGFVPHFYCVSDKRYQEDWEKDYPLQILNRENNKVYFAILSAEGEDFHFPIAETPFPSKSATLLKGELDEVNQKIEEAKKDIAFYIKEIDRLKKVQGELNSKIDLYLAGASSTKTGEDTISVLEGFAPTAEDEKISTFLDQTSALYISSAATLEDNPPVKLKNNKFARVFEPIGSLYVLPKYDELDLTPFYAPFYMLFFGLCLGDMGYGLVLLLLGIVATLFLPKFRGYGQLVIWLGVGATIMPLLSGTIFGMNLAKDFPSLPKDITSLFFDDLKMFWFAIIFGIFHIIFAKMVRAIECFRKKLWDNGLTDVGWALIIIWCTFAYAGVETNRVLLPPIASKVIGIAGLILVLFFSKPAKWFFLRPLKGVISLYDITGVFGDVLSYIRLFGLGTTGGILALVINSIAGEFTSIPVIGWPLTIIMLIFGHLAVMGLSILGAFVHPVRLTFVEFYKNAEFQGGGREYKPLKLK